MISRRTIACAAPFAAFSIRSEFMGTSEIGDGKISADANSFIQVFSRSTPGAIARTGSSTRASSSATSWN